MTIELCPNCRGQKWVQKPPRIAGDQNEWMSAGNDHHKCSTCDGKGYINVSFEDFSSEELMVCVIDGKVVVK